MHMESWPRRHRITVHDYHRMGEIGVFAPDARVVREVWIVDVNGDALLVYGDLREGRYERHAMLERPTSVPLSALPGTALDVAALFTP